MSLSWLEPWVGAPAPPGEGQLTGMLGVWGSGKAFLCRVLSNPLPAAARLLPGGAGSVPLVLLMAVFNHQTFPLCGCIVQNEDRVISASCLAPHCRLA